MLVHQFQDVHDVVESYMAQHNRYIQGLVQPTHYQQICVFDDDEDRKMMMLATMQVWRLVIVEYVGISARVPCRLRLRCMQLAINGFTNLTVGEAMSLVKEQKRKGKSHTQDTRRER